MAKFRINFNGEECEAEVSQQGNTLHVTRNGKTDELLLLQQDDRSFVLQWLLPDGRRRRIRAAGHLNRDQRQIWVNGRTFSYNRVRQRGGGAVVDGSLSSSIPAVVSQILVDIGDAVSVGDKLILLESMKMVIPIQAPYAGLVTAIHCTQGESVQSGIPLIELEE